MDSAYASMNSASSPILSSQVNLQPSGLKTELKIFPELLKVLHHGVQETQAGLVVIAGKRYPVTYSNGYQKYGPPLGWLGVEPTGECEVFVQDLPEGNIEHVLLPHLARFGSIYDCRIMKGFGFNTEARGYAYIRFENESQALRCIEVMKHFLVDQGLTLAIQTSYYKSRLFARNIPKNKTFEEIFVAFKEIFPKLNNILMHEDKGQNRGYCFLDFESYEAAVEAQMSCSPSNIVLWGNEIVVVWAIPEKLSETKDNDENKTLFIRNVGLEVNSLEIRNFITQVVPAKDIVQVTQVRDFAFAEFKSRKAAGLALDRLQGKRVKRTPVNIQWARPAPSNSVHQFKNTHFNTELRLKCIANYWNVPVFIYGRKFGPPNVQVVGVFINVKDRTHIFVVEVHCEGLTNIHSRVSEILVSLINIHGHLPMQHLVLRVQGDVVQTLGYMIIREDVIFMPSNLIDPHTTIYYDEMYDVTIYAKMLAQIDQKALFQRYERTILFSDILDHPTLNLPELLERSVGCFVENLSLYPPLPHGLDNRQLIFALCDTHTKTNFQFVYKPDYPRPIGIYHHNGTVDNEKYLQPMTLLPLQFVQARPGGPCTPFLLFGSEMPKPRQYLQPLVGF